MPRQNPRFWTALACVILAMGTNPLSALEEPVATDEKPAPAVTVDAAEGQQFFEQHVRPLLIAKCIECHGPEKQRAGLRLDSREAMLEGGESGATLVPHEPAESMLVEVISYRSDLKMPPKSKMSDAEIAVLTRWVQIGAPWPNSKPPEPAPSEPAPEVGFTTAQKEFWAFQPIADPTPPAVQNEAWPQSPLDRFILADLEAHGIRPAPPADRRTLLRRVTLDLTGVPPTPSEVTAFLADQTPGAFARVVDRLLQSPRYGERWGRHWLDVARYADSNGLDENLAYANAYRYRDYVIRALNQDKPFNEFLQEQIAGDLLPDSGQPQLQQDRLTATGFLCLGAKMLAEDDPVKMQMDIIDEQVDTICRAFLGLTMGCARCHDHKFDPLSQADYYSLAGIFKSTRTMENFNVVARWQERPLATPEELAGRQQHQSQIDQIKARVAALTQQGQQAALQDARQHVGLYLLAAAREQQISDVLARNKPLGNQADSISVPGAILLEAEDFQRGNVLKDRDTYGKGIGVLVNMGPTPNFTEYDVEFPADGDYQFELRYAAANARPGKLFLDGELLKADVTSQATGSWMPDTQTWFAEGVFPVKAGKHVIRLENDGPFPHIDKLLISPLHEESGQIVRLPESNYKLFAGFTRQVKAELDKTFNDPQSIWAIWHQFRKDGKLQSAGPEGSGAAHLPLYARLIGETAPTSLTELAQRYQELVKVVDQAWATQQSDPAQQSLKQLADAELEAVRKAIYESDGVFAVSAELETRFPADTLALLQTEREQLKAMESTLPQFPEVMAVSDHSTENLKIHLRGSHLTLGQEVPRQFPTILAGEHQPALPADVSGRLELARWLTSAEHPLTSRVIVNRVWLWHFGEGLVRSPDNFGQLGERPTHPQLLDWLARRCLESGWSLKQLHRLILLSSTYQMSTTYDDGAAQQDPENRLWWRMNRRRMDVEELRDSLLAVSGSLDETMGGTALMTPNRQYVTSTANVNPVVYQTNRRSVYLPVIRSALFELFQAFDFADPSVLNGRRDQTTVAPQALFMMNSGFVLAQSQTLATRLIQNQSWNDTQRLNDLYETAFSRPATDAEATRDLAYLQKFHEAAAGKLPDAEIRQRAWTSLVRAVLASNEFVYVE